MKERHDSSPEQRAYDQGMLEDAIDTQAKSKGLIGRYFARRAVKKWGERVNRDIRAPLAPLNPSLATIEGTDRSEMELLGLDPDHLTDQDRAFWAATTPPVPEDLAMEEEYFRNNWDEYLGN